MGWERFGRESLRIQEWANCTFPAGGGFDLFHQCWHTGRTKTLQRPVVGETIRRMPDSLSPKPQANPPCFFLEGQQIIVVDKVGTNLFRLEIICLLEEEIYNVAICTTIAIFSIISFFPHNFSLNIKYNSIIHSHIFTQFLKQILKLDQFGFVKEKKIMKYKNN